MDSEEEILSEEEDSISSSISKTKKRPQKTAIATKSNRKLNVYVDGNNSRSLLSQSRIAAVGYRHKIKELQGNNKVLAKSLEEAQLTIAEKSNRIAQLQWELSSYEAIKMKLNGLSDKVKTMAGVLEEAAVLVSDALDFPQNLPENTTLPSGISSITEETIISQSAKKHARTTFEENAFVPPSLLCSNNMTMIEEAHTEELRMAINLLKNKEAELETNLRRSPRSRPRSINSSSYDSVNERLSIEGKSSNLEGSIIDSPHTPEILKTPPQKSLVSTLEKNKSSIPQPIPRKEVNKLPLLRTPESTKKNTSIVSNRLAKKPIQGPFKLPAYPISKPSNIASKKGLVVKHSPWSRLSTKEKPTTSKEAFVHTTSQATRNEKFDNKRFLLPSPSNEANLRRQTFTVKDGINILDSSQKDERKTPIKVNDSLNLRKTFVLKEPKDKPLVPEEKKTSVADDKKLAKATGDILSSSIISVNQVPNEEMIGDVTSYDLQDMTLTGVLPISICQMLAENKSPEANKSKLSVITESGKQPESETKDAKQKEDKAENTVADSLTRDGLDEEVAKKKNSVSLTRGSGKRVTSLDLSISFESKDKDQDFETGSKKKVSRQSKRLIRCSKGSKTAKSERASKSTRSSLARKSSFAQPLPEPSKKSVASEGGNLGVYEFLDHSNTSLEMEPSDKTKKKTPGKKGMAKKSSLVPPKEKKSFKKRGTSKIQVIENTDKNIAEANNHKASTSSDSINLAHDRSVTSTKADNIVTLPKQLTRKTNVLVPEPEAVSKRRETIANVPLKPIMKSRESILKRNTKRLTVSFNPDLEFAKESDQDSQANKVLIAVTSVEDVDQGRKDENVKVLDQDKKDEKVKVLDQPSPKRRSRPDKRAPSMKSVAKSTDENASVVIVEPHQPSPPKKLKESSPNSVREAEVLRESNCIVNDSEIHKRKRASSSFTANTDHGGVGSAKKERSRKVSENLLERLSSDRGRRRTPVSYKEPSLMRKMRRP